MTNLDWTLDAAALADRIETLHRAYRDVDKGDRYSLTYVPEQGTELALNGQVLTRVAGADFACAYFGIWLGGDPIDDGLRDRLLPVSTLRSTSARSSRVTRPWMTPASSSWRTRREQGEGERPMRSASSVRSCSPSRPRPRPPWPRPTAST